jgi:hypothetical protein
VNRVANPIFQISKVCKGPCGKMLTHDHFGKHRGYTDGLRPVCRECRNRLHRERKNKTPQEGNPKTQGATKTEEAIKRQRESEARQAAKNEEKLKQSAIREAQNAINKDDSKKGFTATTNHLLEHVVRILDGPDKLAEELVEHLHATVAGSLNKSRAIETLMRLVYKANEQMDQKPYASMSKEQLEKMFREKVGELLGRMTPEQQAQIKIAEGTTG